MSYCPCLHDLKSPPHCFCATTDCCFHPLSKQQQCHVVDCWHFLHHGSQAHLAVSSWLRLHVSTCMTLLRTCLLIKVTSNLSTWRKMRALRGATHVQTRRSSNSGDRKAAAPDAFWCCFSQYHVVAEFSRYTAVFLATSMSHSRQRRQAGQAVQR